MIDIHTHILPGIDDGAADYEAALHMARTAAAEGITTIVATPHHANGKYSNPAIQVTELTHDMNKRIKEAGVPVTIMAGQEIRVHDDLLDGWDRKELLTLADSRYILIEFPSSHIPKGINELLHELQLMNLTAIIAHPERNAEIVKHPERLDALTQEGALAQVTTHSLLGGFGKRIEQSAWGLCRSGLIHLVSSDAHHVDRRGFRLREAYDAIRERMGEDWAVYFKNNANCILEDRPFSNMPATLYSSQGVFRRMLSFFHVVKKY